MGGTKLAILCTIFSGYFVISTAKSLTGHLDSGENEVRCRTMNDFLTSQDCVKSTLKSMGYFRPSEDVNQYREAIEQYQKFYKLKVTGVIDEETADLLSQPGCGVPDKIPESSKVTPDKLPNRKRSKRQIELLFTPYWPFTRISWCISSYSKHLSTTEQDNAMKWALQQWSDNSRLTFYKISNCDRAVIEVKWATGSHGDDNHFDGEGGTLAHAILPAHRIFVPKLAGDVHLDDSENWSVATDQGSRYERRVFLKPIALHELGHSLGLQHSDLRDSIMYRYHRNVPYRPLHPTDIQAIQNYYGMPIRSNDDPIEAINVCSGDSRITVKAIAMMGDGITYAFNGPRYWRIGKNGLIDRQSKEIRQNWRDTSGRGLEGDFDAVLFIPTGDCTPRCRGNTYFIKGSSVWEIENSDGTSGVARRHDINRIFPQAPLNMDGALLHNVGLNSTRDLNIYFIKGGEYFRAVNIGPPYRIISVNPLSVLWDQGWREGNFRAATTRWVYNPVTRSTTLDNCFFLFGHYGCYSGGSNTLVEGFPRDIRYWYGCDGYETDKTENNNPDRPEDNNGDGDDVEEEEDAGGNDNGDEEPQSPNNDGDEVGDDGDVEDNPNNDGPESPGRSANPGVNSGRRPTSVGRPLSPINPSPLCVNLPQIQAITMMGDGLVYAFSGGSYWRKSLQGETDRELKSITSNWFGEGLVGYFDAVVFRPSEACNPTCRGTTYFFQQDKIFVQKDSFGTQGFLRRYDFRILPSLPIGIDSATIVRSSGCELCFDLYFVKGNDHYITSDTHSISHSNPYQISPVSHENQLWRGPGWESLNAVFYPWSRRDSAELYYLFRGTEYVLFDATSNSSSDHPQTVTSFYRC